MKEIGIVSNKILITYASRTGTTAGVAEAIGKTLGESGGVVDVRPMTEVKDLTPYQAVVAGSAIQGKQWLPEAMQFMQTNQAALRQKPFAAFLVCMTLAMKKGDYRDEVRAWLAGAFAGAAGERGPFCRRAGPQQGAIVARQADVSHQHRHGRVVGGRSPRLGRHPRLGREHQPATART